MTLASRDVVRQLLDDASKAVSGHKFSLRFLMTEWEQVVDAWQLASWEDYRDVSRLGRKTRLPEPQRALLWAIFAEVCAALAGRKLPRTHAGLFTSLALTLSRSKHTPFDFAVVDEAQTSAWRTCTFWRRWGQSPRRIVFSGDLGQRIFQQPFFLEVAGRGHSRPVAHAAHQLPNFPPNPPAGRPVVG